MNETYRNPDTDGRFYDLESMVRADCHDCAGCHECCQNMGDSVVLDPYDMYQFRVCLKKGLYQLLGEGALGLGVYDGLVLPHIQMSGDEGACSFLKEGRCSIHDYRPGICRLFPLGRNYEDGRMNYVLLNRACAKANRTKIKVSKWIGISDSKAYQDFLLKWHDFKKEMLFWLREADAGQAGSFQTYLLETFYIVQEMDEAAFYEGFYHKMDKIKNAFGI